MSDTLVPSPGGAAVREGQALQPQQESQEPEHTPVAAASTTSAEGATAGANNDSTAAAKATAAENSNMDLQTVPRTTDELDRRRVKVYRLSVEEDTWHDIGTGQVACTHNKLLNRMCIRVKSEDTDEVILESKIGGRQTYTQQGDTIITWEDEQTECRDLAVSFQEPEGCKEVWNEICAIQEQFVAEISDYEYVPSSQEDEGGPTQEVGGRMCEDMPPCDLGHIDDLVNFFAETLYSHKDVIASMVMRQDYVPKLLELFKTVEDLEDLPTLHKLFKIMRGVVLLNDAALLQFLLNENNHDGMFGMLEYDPEVEDSTQRIKHRDYLKERALFKNVAVITNESVLYKIHQNFRIMYLKDVALARYLDEVTFNALNSILYLNNTDIVVGIQNDNSIITPFFQSLEKESNSAQEKRDMVLWLQELCNLSRPTGVQERSAFWRTMMAQGMFAKLEHIFWTDDQVARNAISEIMVCSLVHDGALLRGYLISDEQKKGGNRTLHGLVETITSGTDVGMKGQISDILRMLMDPETLDGSSDKEDFLNIFYENLIGQLVKPIVDWDESVPNGTLSGDFDQEEAHRHTIMVVIELLSFCVTHHGYRMKYFLIRNQVLHKMLNLLKHKERAMQLCAIRFLRTCIGIKDDFYHRVIIKENLFEPVMALFQKNGNRYNLLNSAIIEIFAFIKASNIRKLVQYTVEKFSHIIKDIDYVDTFHMLYVRHEQNREGLDAGPSTVNADAMLGRKRGRGSDDEQEDYFSKDEDEAEAAAAAARGGVPVAGVPGAKKPNTGGGDRSQSAGPAPADGNGTASQPGALGAAGAAGAPAVPAALKALGDYADDDDDELFGPPPPPKAAADDDESGEIDFRKLSQRQPVVQSGVPKAFKFHF